MVFNYIIKLSRTYSYCKSVRIPVIGRVFLLYSFFMAINSAVYYQNLIENPKYRGEPEMSNISYTFWAF